MTPLEYGFDGVQIVIHCFSFQSIFKPSIGYQILMDGLAMIEASISESS